MTNDGFRNIWLLKKLGLLTRECLPLPIASLIDPGNRVETDERHSLLGLVPR